MTNAEMLDVFEQSLAMAIRIQLTCSVVEDEYGFHSYDLTQEAKDAFRGVDLVRAELLRRMG